jgi:hypothetical protein
MIQNETAIYQKLTFFNPNFSPVFQYCLKSSVYHSLETLYERLLYLCTAANMSLATVFK